MMMARDQDPVHASLQPIILIFAGHKHGMTRIIICVLFFISSGSFTQAKSPLQSFDKSVYYQLMQAGNLDEINKQLALIDSVSNINKEAYGGALLMKKAGMVKNPSQKLSLFKEGHKKLEAAIQKENENAEWRFLRLIIQEHAPKMLNYNSAVKTDAEFIQSSFQKLSPAVQSAVMNYRKHSETLKTFNF